MTEPIEPAEDTATWSQEPEPELLPKGEVDSEPAADDDVSDDELDPAPGRTSPSSRKRVQGLRARLRDAEEIAGAASARENVHTREAVAAAAAQAGLIDGNDLFIAHPTRTNFWTNSSATLSATVSLKPHKRCWHRNRTSGGRSARHHRKGRWKV